MQILMSNGGAENSSGILLSGGAPSTTAAATIHSRARVYLMSVFTSVGLRSVKQLSSLIGNREKLIVSTAIVYSCSFYFFSNLGEYMFIF